MAASVLPASAVAPVIAPALLTIEEYLRTSYKPDFDFVDGVLEERSLGEFSHNRLQALLIGWFLAHEAEFSVVAVPEQRIQVTRNHVRVADLAVLRADSPREDVTITPPLLCVEIMSREDRLSRAKTVLADYLAMGVAHIWLIDPRSRGAYVFDAAGLRLLESTERLEIAGTPIFLPLDDLFARLD